MNKRNVIIITVTFFVLAFAFVFSIYGKGITGFFIKEEGEKPAISQGLIYGDPNALLHDYKSNLYVDNIKLPDESVSVDQIIFLSSLHLKNSGKNIDQFSLNRNARKYSNDVPVERFQAYYSKKNGNWLVSYIKKVEPHTICDVRVELNGTLIEIECKDS